MIADAWYSVTEYHLRMGTKDKQGNSVNSIERAVNKLDALNGLDHTADRQQIVCMIESNEKLLHDEKYQISKNVPYRLLSSFMKELGGNDPLWDQSVRRHIVGGANRTLISVLLPLRLCRIGTCRRLQTE